MLRQTHRMRWTAAAFAVVMLVTVLAACAGSPCSVTRSCRCNDGTKAVYGCDVAVATCSDACAGHGGPEPGAPCHVDADCKPLSCCDGVCGDLSNDVYNCGNCGNNCWTSPHANIFPYCVMGNCAS
jgi:hypothetical protein